MYNKILRLIKPVFLVLVLLITPATIMGSITSIEVIPNIPCVNDTAIITVRGYLPDACWSVDSADMRIELTWSAYVEIQITIHAIDRWLPGTVCAEVIMPYQFSWQIPVNDIPYWIIATEMHTSLRNPESNQDIASFDPQKVPDAPHLPYIFDSTVCVGDYVCLNWNQVPDARIYELSLNGSIVYRGPGNHYYLPLIHPGIYCFWIRACNDCGCSPPLIGPITCFNAEQCYSISGNAFWDSAGVRAPMENVIVELESDVTSFFYADTTRQDGAFLFHSVIKSDYCLTAVPHSNCVYVLSTAFFDSLAGGGATGINIRYDGGPDGIPTDVVNELPGGLPSDYSLSQNYPNPFNPTTQIEFEIPRASFIEIHIYNMLGQQLRTLVSERLSAGRKVVTWDGRDNHGTPVSSGIYFYRIEAEGFVQTKKMLILK